MLRSVCSGVVCVGGTRHQDHITAGGVADVSSRWITTAPGSTPVLVTGIMDTSWLSWHLLCLGAPWPPFLLVGLCTMGLTGKHCQPTYSFKGTLSPK